MKAKNLIALLLVALAIYQTLHGGGGILPFGPAPIAGDGFQVAIFENIEDRSALPPEQLTALTSTNVTAYLNAKCVKTNGVAGWRHWDKDLTDAQITDDTRWKDALHKAATDSKGVYPWILVSTGKSGTSEAFPKNEADTLALLKKYGGS